MTNSVSAGYAAVLLRLSLGSLAIAHGLLKTFVYGLPATASYFETIGIPGFMAYLVAVGEVGGGILLLLGVFTRAVALLQLPILAGATTVSLPNGWVFTEPNGGWEFPALWAVLLVVQLLLGDGPLSLGRYMLAWLRPALSPLAQKAHLPNSSAGPGTGRVLVAPGFGFAPQRAAQAESVPTPTTACK